MNMVVLPDPVGDETPMRRRPRARASRHDSIASCWYDRRTTAGGPGSAETELVLAKSVDAIHPALSVGTVFFWREGPAVEYRALRQKRA